MEIIFYKQMGIFISFSVFMIFFIQNWKNKSWVPLWLAWGLNWNGSVEFINDGQISRINLVFKMVEPCLFDVFYCAVFSSFLISMWCTSENFMFSLTNVFLFFFLYIYTCIFAHFSFVTGTRCKSDYFQEKEKKELPKNQRTSTGVLDSNYLITCSFNVILLILILLDEWLSSSGVDKVKDNWYSGNWETWSCIDWKAFKTC